MAPVLVALLAVSCGRNIKHDGRPGADASAGGSDGTTGVGGATGSGIADAGVDQATMIDGGNDLPPDAAECPVDCTTLPHVRAGANVQCTNGICDIGYGHAFSCDTGFGHCNGQVNVGCEADMTASPNCGLCGIRCDPGGQCQLFGGDYGCPTVCPAQRTLCLQAGCVDMQSDPQNCGACGNGCGELNAMTACQGGHCVTFGCYSTFADCDGTPGCETALGSAANCGGCNDPACTLANTMFTCSDGLGCQASICEVGFANCDTSSPNCETAVASTPPASGSCLPQSVGAVEIPRTPDFSSPAFNAVAADGSFFIARSYEGTVDFDPSSSGEDIHTATNFDVYVTKFNADGSYAWTATLVGSGNESLGAIAATPAGGVIVSGSYPGTIDLDPSAGEDIRGTSGASSSDSFIVNLSASGAEVWGRTFTSMSLGSIGANAEAVDAAGSVYVLGYFSGTVDLDPGAGTDVHTAPPNAYHIYIVKLTSTGDRVWSHIVDADNAGCHTIFRAMLVTSDGSAWATGLVEAAGTCALTPVNVWYQSVLIWKVSADGTTSASWALGDSPTAEGTAITAGSDGAVYIGGIVAGDVDMDPGPEVARRWFGPVYKTLDDQLYPVMGFVLKLAADGTYQWARVLGSAAKITAMAPAPDGGLIAAGRAVQDYGQPFVTRLTPSGASVWTVPLGNGAVELTSAASNATTFAVGGFSSGTQDFDPGPATDLISGDVSFVSHFRF